MNPAQTHAVDALLKRLADKYPTRTLCGLHGDCIGADAVFDAICKRRSIPVKVRPATTPRMRAGCDSEVIAEPRRPLVRNREIVADSDLLIACPTIRGSRQAVWATVQMMQRAGRPIYLVTYDGAIHFTGGKGPP